MPTTDLTSLAVLALAMLVEKPMHPYEMFQTMVQRRHDRLVKLRAGSLYHTVDRLVRDGLVEPVGTDRAGNRPERTTYRITELGTVRLGAALADGLAVVRDEFPRFTVAISEAHNVPADETAALLRTRLEALHARRELFETGVRKLTERGLPLQFWIDLDYQQAMLAAEIAWLERFVAELDAGSIPWNTDEADATRPAGTAIHAALALTTQEDPAS